MIKLLFSSILNIPWNLSGILFAVISVPTRAQIHRPYALVFTVKSLWWAKLLPSYREVRAVTIGQVVLLGGEVKQRDLQHELAHVAQAVRAPLVQPVLYTVETIRFGYRSNKYEKEARAQERAL